MILGVCLRIEVFNNIFHHITVIKKDVNSNACFWYFLCSNVQEIVISLRFKLKRCQIIRKRNFVLMQMLRYSWINKFEANVSGNILVQLLQYYMTYTGAPVVGTPILGTHYIVSCDAEVCGAERESSRTIQGRMHWAVYFALLSFASGATLV